MSSDRKIAFYKLRPTRSMPTRPGPVQCVRNCTNCIVRYSGTNIDDEDTVALKSYERLELKHKLIPCPQIAIYHAGQVDILKQVLIPNKKTISLHIIAVSRYSDLEIYKTMCKNLDPLSAIEFDQIPTTGRMPRPGQHIIVPIRLESCVVDVSARGLKLLEVRGLRDFLEPFVKKALKDLDFNVILVPIVISKDKDTSGVASSVNNFCIQILEPYLLQEYLNDLKTVHKVGHLTQHIYYDLARSMCHLPCHLIAFISVYSDRPDGVSQQDLIDYVEWLRFISMEIGLQVPFTGSTEHVVQYGVFTLGGYLNFDSTTGRYRVKNSEALEVYAKTITPNIAYYGIIARAILMLFNCDHNNQMLVHLKSGYHVRVMKDDVIELSLDLAEIIDYRLPCRRPCSTVDSCINEAFSYMQTFGKFFTVQEPRIQQKTGFGWAGDYDSDEEYFRSKRDDPAFKSWITLTDRPNRLDRLNLLINAVAPHLEDTSD